MDVTRKSQATSGPLAEGLQESLMLAPPSRLPQILLCVGRQASVTRIRHELDLNNTLVTFGRNDIGVPFAPLARGPSHRVRRNQGEVCSCRSAHPLTQPQLDLCWHQARGLFAKRQMVGTIEQRALEEPPIPDRSSPTAPSRWPKEPRTSEAFGKVRRGITSATWNASNSAAAAR